MKKSYFGFVYLWRDRLRKMSYIGSHMGSLNDPHEGSSTRLLCAMKKRPADFRRKILWILTTDDRKLLLIEEERWLQMIKPEHLQVRYYNVKRRGTGGYVTEGYTIEQRKTYIERLSRSRRGKLHYAVRACHCAGQDYAALADAKRFLGWDPVRRIRSRRFIDFFFIDEGQPTAEEVQLLTLRRADNNKKSINAMRRTNKSMPAEYHKERTRIAGLKRRGKQWTKTIAERAGRSVIIEGVTFMNLRHAADVTKLSAYLIKQRCSSPDWPGYEFLETRPFA